MSLSKLRSRLFGSAARKRFFTVTSGKVVAALLQALFFALFAQTMGLDAFGVYSIGYALTLVVMSLFEFGFGSLSLRISRETEPNRVMSTMLATRVCTNVIVVTAVVVGWTLVSGVDTMVAVLIALSAIGETWANLVQNIMIGQYRERASVGLLVSRRAAMLVAALVVLLLAGVNSPSAGYALIGVGGAVTVLFASAFMASRFAVPNNPFPFLASRRRYWAASLADNARQLDTVIIGAIGGAQLAGLFGAANRLIAPLNLLTSSVMQSLVPELVSRHDKNLDNVAYMRKVVRLMTIAAVVIGSASVTAPILIVLLYGQEFFEAWPIAVAVFIMAALNTMNQSFFAWEYMRGVALYLPLTLAVSTFFYLAVLTAASALDSVWAIAVGLVVVGLATHAFFRWRFFVHLSKEGSVTEA